MAEKKTAKKTAVKKTAAKPASKKAADRSENEKQNENEKLRRQIKELKMQQAKEDTLSYQIMPIVLIFAAVFLIVCYIMPDNMGLVSNIVGLFKGFFAGAMWVIPVSLAVYAMFWQRDYVEDKAVKKLVVHITFIAFCAVLVHLVSGYAELEPEFNPAKLYNMAKEGNSAGVIGGLIGGLLCKLTGFGAWIITIFVLLILLITIFNFTPSDVAQFIKDKTQEVAYEVNLERQKHLEENIERKKGEMIARANEKSIEQEAKDATQLRMRRAYLEDAGETCGSDENELLPKEEIKPVLTKDEPVTSYNNGEGSEAAAVAASVVNMGAFNEVKQAGKNVMDSLSGGFSVSDGQAPDLDSFGESEVSNDVKNVLEATSAPGEETFVNKKTEFAVDEATGEVIDTKENDDADDFSKIFTDDASIAIAGVEAGASVVNGVEAKLTDRIGEGSELGSENEKVPVQPLPKIEEVYNFPPINFLKTDPNPLTFTVTDELKQTSIKLVETLKNFGVKTRIMNICCGPTVTRYELQPEIGVRVRSIANLSDDIALHLAAAGVRIEAPIPGKDAVGIEIPNKTVSTVYLRNLIESSGFENQKSKITVCLGMDVAGSPIYMNIAKMPHMLIAGATGMGKSVCINSFIVSMLYKANPKEVKLILIDPKKVELSIYNGLPHLLVPVVSDPKKAAGSLAWAVNEMERRFLLIEEVGVRDIDTYNEVTKDDPEKEYMPKIVIIIDELADLMMTARDEVETSICRLAQKARAAGMHLVIGTQRPSVDVITGLIKANVPSRIAFTVASQVDSRTIIDVAGAEKLLGRGDMLYAPVGSMKPIRVQGSFVSEKEIENIVEFLKNGKTYEYDADIMESIEREAARCGEKKKGRGASDEFGDESEDKESIIMSDDSILPAIEIAVDSGSVSTSLLQRKLSLGYARAARIVDKLEKLGVVGPFEGSKPRKVLITREEYLEMRMNYEGGDE